MAVNMNGMQMAMNTDNFVRAAVVDSLGAKLRHVPVVLPEQPVTIKFTGNNYGEMTWVDRPRINVSGSATLHPDGKVAYAGDATLSEMNFVSTTSVSQAVSGTFHVTDRTELARLHPFAEFIGRTIWDGARRG